MEEDWALAQLAVAGVEEELWGFGFYELLFLPLLLNFVRVRLEPGFGRLEVVVVVE